MTKWEYATVPLLTHATKQILDTWGEDGWELVAVIGALGLLLAATGAGRFSVDQVVLGRSRVSQPATAAA